MRAHLMASRVGVPVSHKRRWHPLATAILLIAAALVAADYLVGLYQQRLINQRREEQARVERMAWKYVRVDVDDIGYTEDGRYKVRLWIENLFPEYDVFVMVPSVQGYVQVGPRWQEVRTVEATQDQKLKEGSVIKLKGRATVDWILEVPPVEFFQAFPGYMHVDINSQMLVSAEAEPKEHVAERTDHIYVHVKPIGADDGALSRLNRFPGPVPVFIPTVPRR